MLNLFEILQNAQGGQLIANLARQFDLSQQQAQAALDAMLPAFSIGLKRQASDPAAASNLFATLAAQNVAVMQSMAGLGAGNPFAKAAAAPAPDVLGAFF